MVNVLSKLKIAHKLGIAACAFAVPIAFILWSLVAEQNVAIRFASKEVMGARYLAGIARLQGQLDIAALNRTGLPDRAADALAALGASARGLKVEPQLSAAVSALRAASAPSALADARDKLHDLIDRVADRSNLTLDNVLATNHLSDVVLNGLPDAVDRIADLTLAQEKSAKDSKAQARFLVGLGALKGDLGSMDDSLTAAEQAPGGGHIKAALDGDYQNLRASLSGFIKSLKAGTASPRAARRQVAQVTRFSRSTADELAWILKARVARLHEAELRMFGLTLLLFLAAVGGMLWALCSGVTRPLARITESMRSLAGGDLEVEVPGIGRGDEIGAMAGAVQVFKENALRTQALEQEQEQGRQAAEAERREHEAE
ncbi:MAG TPA: HAMP domain-containing protein, partial [Acetobacteraceae bacterium]|nr:HAMP domain-containing protein [Acetobacteraceae bacterium]